MAIRALALVEAKFVKEQAQKQAAITKANALEEAWLEATQEAHAMKAAAEREASAIKRQARGKISAASSLKVEADEQMGDVGTAIVEPEDEIGFE